MGGDGDVVHPGAKGIVDMQACFWVDFEEAIEQRVAVRGVFPTMNGKNHACFRIKGHATNVGHRDAAE